MDTPKLGGTVFSKDIKEWVVSWESHGHYRHWCVQRKFGKDTDEFVAVVLFNPGSLSADGKELPKDTTLRNLREIFEDVDYGCLVLNLFDLAAPRSEDFFARWSRRDRSGVRLVHGLIESHKILSVMFAYGNYENEQGDPTIAGQIRDRISVVRDHFTDTPVIDTPKNSSGTPKACEEVADRRPQR
jgi:hypothetical protein